MVWTIDQEPRDGIMFRGQGTVKVRNRKGEVGMASVEYHPTVRVVGPVVEPDSEWKSDPTRGDYVLDRRPTFRG
jgi:hypothetical protein